MEHASKAYIRVPPHRRGPDQCPMRHLTKQ